MIFHDNRYNALHLLHPTLAVAKMQSIEMKRILLFVFILLQSQTLQAGIGDIIRAEFKNPDESTNWQHVANWSGGILIILLSVAVISLFFTWRQARKSNLELKAIRNDLELRVQERTATLDESNRLLKESNQLLENEIAQHVATTGRLHSSEAYIKNILKSMPLMLIGVGKDGQITQWNKQAEEITGLKTENVLGKNLWDVYPAITVSPSQVNDAIQKNEATTIKHSQRGQYYYDITIYPLQEQTESGAVILVDDVTKKILAENMLIQSDKMSSVGELASTMAYDINMPLQSILFDLRAFQHLLTDSSQNISDIGTSGTPEKLKNLLDDAYEKGENVASIVRNLQDFARGRSNRKQSSNIIDIMEHTLELASDALSDPSGLRFKDIHIERSYEQNLPMIPCYVAELQHALLSLFRHAYVALGRVERPNHLPTIKIQMIVGYDSLWIRIQHNGVGLNNEEQMYLFEPVFRKDLPDVNYDASKRLSFAYFIITEQHQGQMAVTSDINVGTTFHIEMPLK